MGFKETKIYFERGDNSCKPVISDINGLAIALEKLGNTGNLDSKIEKIKKYANAVVHDDGEIKKSGIMGLHSVLPAPYTFVHEDGIYVGIHETDLLFYVGKKRNNLK